MQEKVLKTEEKEKMKRRLIKRLREIAEQLGRSLSQNDVRSTLIKQAYRYFGSWNNAKLAAGLPIRAKNFWSREKVAVELRKLAHRLGYSPRWREANYGLQRATKKYFGSWNEAKRAVGLEVGINKYNNHYNCCRTRDSSTMVM
ncbi:MAG: hypothetical protein AB1485_09695 [Candidatus Thermoplasmatota archaeon]